jgi:hypothetical protein
MNVYSWFLCCVKKEKLRKYPVKPASAPNESKTDENEYRLKKRYVSRTEGVSINI